jgi:NAD(P)-dependent dehydrogenase (short-subunit alcohol dehydrogenase family)
MRFDFSNRIAVVTGAAGNLGMAVARAFHSSGSKLALVDHLPGRKFLPDLDQAPDYLLTSPTDITDPRSVAQMFDEVHRRFKRIDILVNTVGGYRAGTPLHETPLSDWDFMINLNARSVFITCHEVIPHMLRQGYGKIINVASRAALVGEANHAAYSASKSAVVRLTETMAAELKNSEINVNCTMPGIIDTPPNRAAMPGADFSKWVSPEAVAEVILFLASDAARAINGAAVPVYGKG